MAETAGVPASRGSAVSIALAWAVVVLPAAWGIYNTVIRAMRLFH